MAANDTILLLKAAPHRWGPGKTHVYLADRHRTLCGKTLAGCSGRNYMGHPADVDCKGCLSAQASQQKREQRRAEFERRRAEWSARGWQW